MMSSLGPDGHFGHVMKIFIGASFPRMGFQGYIVCLYVNVACNIYFLTYWYLIMLILT